MSEGLPEANKRKQHRVEADKVYDLRNLAGEIDERQLETYRALDEELSNKFDSYITILPFGSRMRGYSIGEASDYDIRFLIDSETDDANACAEYVMTELAVDFKDTYQSEIHCGYTTLSEKEVVERIKEANEDTGSYYAMETILLLSGLSVGKRIEKYREIAKHEMMQLAEDKKRLLFARVVAFVVDLERGSWKKIAERAGLDEIIDKDAYLEKRKKLWSERLLRMWSA